AARAAAVEAAKVAEAEARAEEAAVREAGRRRRLHVSAVIESPAPVLGEGVAIDLKLEMRLPERYIADERQRIELYRKLAAARDELTIDATEAELRDRFGPPPAVVRTLLRWTRLRALADELEVARVSGEGKMAVLRYAGAGAALRARLAATGADAR